MTDQTTPAGAMPVAGGATPPQTPPAPPAADPLTTSPTPATGDPDALGDAGKRALDAMKAEREAAKERAKAAEKALADLQAATLSDSEKAIAEAKKAGGAEVLAKVTARIRQAEARAALIAAGAQASLVDLAVRADEFTALKVSDDGEIEGLEAAIAAFQKAHPDIFTKPAKPAPGSADGGPRPPGTPKATDLTSAVAAKLAGPTS
jgi:hypothetical protein